MKIDRYGFIALLLAGTLALVGCGGSPDSGSKASTDEKEDAPQEQPAESPEPEQEPEPEPECAGSFLVLQASNARRANAITDNFFIL